MISVLSQAVVFPSTVYPFNRVLRVPQVMLVCQSFGLLLGTIVMDPKIAQTVRTAFSAQAKLSTSPNEQHAPGAVHVRRANTLLVRRCSCTAQEYLPAGSASMHGLWPGTLTAASALHMCRLLRRRC